MTAETQPALAYSYARFSYTGQAAGDSLRRQTDGRAERFCERHGLTLDTSLSLRDLGVSAFRGKQRSDKHDLGKFLELARQGRIPAGSYFIVENLDRLSREEERTALRLWMDLLDLKINIVQLEPETIFRHEKSDMFDIVRAIMELARGHGESALKSDRVGEAWGERRRRSREEGEVLTRRLPAWVEERGGRLALIPGRAASVRRLFLLAAEGCGCTTLLRRLEREKVPPVGRSGKWVRSYVGLLLRDRRVLGEFQPRLLDGTPDGPPIPNYFPPVVTEEEWYAGRAGVGERRGRGGRLGNRHVNVFANLLHDARSGGNYVLRSRTDAAATVVPAGSQEGTAPWSAFPLDTLERAVFALLAEVDPREILGRVGEPDEVLTLSGELAWVDGKIAELEAELLEGDVPAVVRVLRRQEDRKRELVGRLTQARERAASPLGEAWGEAGSLLAALDHAPDQEAARLRLRGVLRRIVGGIYILAVPCGGWARLAAVQVWFTGGEKSRDYLIYHRSLRTNGGKRRPALWWARSLASVVKPGNLDLRNPDHARQLEKALNAVDPATLEEQP
jgi:DNA invertase Pin-like site-specific DNA recombinase